MIKIEPTETVAHYSAVRALLQEYVAGQQGELLPNQSELEPEQLEQLYQLPQGQMLLAHQDQDPAGCVAFHALSDEVCEMRQLYVSPRYRGSGIGRGLVMTLLIEAEKAGYRKMRLDAVAEMKAARELYESMGFYEIAEDSEMSDVNRRRYEIDFKPAERKSA